MSYALRKGPCQVCGVYTERNRSAVTPHRCIDCAIQAAFDAAEQMRNKNGPAWDRWLAARPKALERQATARHIGFRRFR